MSYFAVNSTDVLGQQDRLLRLIKDHTSGQWLGLVDTAFDHGGASLNWSGQVLPLYLEGGLTALAEASPILIPLTVQDTLVLGRELLKLLRHCSGRPMLSFLCAAVPAEVLRQRWQGLLQVVLDEDEHYLLRFADTRISPAIAAMRESGLWSRLSAPVKTWCVVDRQGEVRTLVPLQVSSSIPEQSSGPLKLSEVAWTELLAAGQPDALINALHQDFAEFLPTEDRAAVHGLMVEVNGTALANGVEDFPDVLGLAVATLASGGNLLRDPRLPDWLRQRSWQPGQFDQALLEFLETA